MAGDPGSLTDFPVPLLPGPRFPSTESGDSQLLQGCYDYMNTFKQVLDSSSKIQMDYICLQYPGFFRFAQMMELLAQGIADGVIQVPKEQ
ncbi:arylsulfatase regulator [Pseudomonas savastanoi]|uniref:arylsulfatase regulator n=1 Tax=Pseudomonas savastanoi TaxID=29438 RepID=UPI000EFE6437|nr:arylsulfatase regulator [Pseudomonas savastanoi]